METSRVPGSSGSSISLCLVFSLICTLELSGSPFALSAIFLLGLKKIVLEVMAGNNFEALIDKKVVNF